MSQAGSGGFALVLGKSQLQKIWYLRLVGNPFKQSRKSKLVAIIMIFESSSSFHQISNPFFHFKFWNLGTITSQPSELVPLLVVNLLLLAFYRQYIIYKGAQAVDQVSLDLVPVDLWAWQFADSIGLSLGIKQAENFQCSFEMSLNFSIAFAFAFVYGQICGSDGKLYSKSFHTFPINDRTIISVSNGGSNKDNCIIRGGSRLATSSADVRRRSSCCCCYFVREWNAANAMSKYPT